MKGGSTKTTAFLFLTNIDYICNMLRGKAKQELIDDEFVKDLKKHFNCDAVRELRFHPVRRWRFDFAIPKYNIAIEKEGGVWTMGRHTRGKGYINDMEKYNNATALGWRVLRFTPDQLLKKETLEIIKKTIEYETYK